jgi:Tol biopolymer transport system component
MRLTSAIALFAGWWWSTRGTSRSETPLKVVPLTTGAGVERNPSFSPDGSQIVYEWAREDGKRHLYIMVVGSGDPVPLTYARIASERNLIPFSGKDGKQSHGSPY